MVPIHQTSPSGLPDWVNWTGFAATILGVLVSVVGLWATFLQARAAKKAAKGAETAAELAQTAVSEAVDQLHSRNALSSLSSTISQITHVMEQVRRQDIAAARLLFAGISRGMREAMYYRDSKRSHSGNALGDVDVTIKEISALLNQEAASELERETILSSLQEVFDRMSTEEAKRKWGA